MNLGPHQNYVSAVHHLLIIGIGTVLEAQVFLCAAPPALLPSPLARPLRDKSRPTLMWG